MPVEGAAASEQAEKNTVWKMLRQKITVSLSVFPLKEKIFNGFRKKENHNVASYSLCMSGVFVILCCLPLTLFPCKVFCFFEGSGISGWKKARLFLFEASEQCPTSLGCYKKQLWS